MALDDKQRQYDVELVTSLRQTAKNIEAKSPKTAYLIRDAADRIEQLWKDMPQVEPAPAVMEQDNTQQT
jgi:hypothetical protein